MMRRVFLIAAATLACGALADPYVTETIALDEGENWVYVEATPTNDACAAVFADCPSVTSVRGYDATAYDRTAQYDSEGNPINQKPVAFLVWHRAKNVRSTLQRIQGGMTYLINATSACSVTLTGRPQLPRLRWFQTLPSDENWNLVAPSLPHDEKSVSFSAYFGEGPAGLSPSIVEMQDGHTLHPISVSPSRVAVKPGRAYYMTATRTADWPGVIGVIGADNGLTFVSNGECRLSFTLQNMGTTNHTFRLSYGPGDTGAREVPALKLLDGTDWADFDSGSWREFELAPNGQVSVTLAAPPTSRAAGSGLLTVTDRGASKMRVRLPLVVQSTAQAGGLWPDGLYLGSFTLDSVTYTNATPVRAGGSVKGTLIYHQKGTQGTLLQRLCLGAETNGVAVYGLDLAPVRAKAAPGSKVRRISSVVLDPYNPRVFATVSDGTGRFAWKVDKHAATNPMRHSWHPDHDGPRRLSNGTTVAAPDGDDFNNYSESVKPELFSIDNTVVLTGLPVATNLTGAIEGSASGRITWTLGNLRSATSGGDITCSGTFSLMRVGDVDEIK